jgi:membrane-bound lytic murein transglycosylase A
VRGWARGFALASLALLSACVSRPVQPPTVQPPPPVTQPTPPTPPPPANAVQAGIRLVEPRLVDESNAERALATFRISCPVVTRRADKSGLTFPGDWSAPCAAASAVQAGSAAAFFQTQFDWVQVGIGKAFATGYYEPEIAASRVPAPGYTVPIYMVPPDLVRCTRADGTTGRGRIDPGTGLCVPYYSRTDIENGALAGKGLEIAWAADPVDVFFAEIQGSARLVFPDGSATQIGYADQNGLAYVPVGRLLKQQGILPPGGTNMQAIKAWMHANPAQGQQLMLQNPSYIFFKVLSGPGPLGALNVPITAQGTVAADPAFVPLGAPIFLAMDRPEPDGLWVAQDVGGAIKGANRFDTFWGSGPEAAQTAGGMAASGQALVLIPKGTAQRAFAHP